MNTFWMHVAKARKFWALASARLHIQASWAWVSADCRCIASFCLFSIELLRHACHYCSESDSACLCRWTRSDRAAFGMVQLVDAFKPDLTESTLEIVCRTSCCNGYVCDTGRRGLFSFRWLPEHALVALILASIPRLWTCTSMHRSSQWVSCRCCPVSLSVIGCLCHRKMMEVIPAVCRSMRFCRSTCQ